MAVISPLIEEIAIDVAWRRVGNVPRGRARRASC
jgi:hypothetical protein